jgi:hypothetical protein
VGTSVARFTANSTVISPRHWAVAAQIALTSVSSHCWSPTTPPMSRMSTEHSSDPVHASRSIAPLATKFAGADGPYLAGAALFICALIFYYFAVLQIDFAKTTLLDLRPYTDASEYFAQAKGLQTEGDPRIQIGYDKLPSKMPVGYPALMVLWLKILPTEQQVLAPFRTNQTIGLLLLFVVFATYSYFALPVTGGIAALLLATLPGFFTYCRSSMSDISASALVALAFLFVFAGLKHERRWQIYLGAFVLGLSLNVRTQLLFLAPLLLAMPLFAARQSILRRFLHSVGALAVFALAAAPTLVLNTLQFGSPLKTGYSFWLKRPVQQLFSVQNIPKNVAMLWSQFALEPRDFTSANMFGTGTFFVPAFALLVLAGLRFIRINRFAICAFLAGFTYFAATTTFLFSLGRLYLTLLILLVSIAALPVVWATQNLTKGKERITALCVLALFAAACAGYPSNSGFNAGARLKRGHVQAWDAVHFTTTPQRSVCLTATNELVQKFRSQPGIVLSDIDPVYLNALLPKPFVAAPLDQKHHYRFSKLWRYDRPQALALVEKGLEQSMPIYALFVSPKEMEEKATRLPTLPGYEWRAVLSDNDAIVLALAKAPGNGAMHPHYGAGASLRWVER